MQQVWQIKINPQRSPDFVQDIRHPEKFESGKVKRARDYCFRKGWAGIGWEAKGLNCDLSDHTQYIAALDRSSESKLGYDPESAKGPCIAFATRMQNGDFVWCKTAADTYWLGKITGPWTYKHGGNFAKFDLYQVRKCKWVEVGTGDKVPGPVKNAFAGPGRALARISTEGEAALLGSALLWKSLAKEAINFDLKPFKKFPLGAIAHDDLEDVVALYLQIKRGWYVVPSTVKKSTATTEFVLRNRVGNRAYLQVKSGKRKIDVTELTVPKDVDYFFLFYPTIGKVQSPNKSTKFVQIDASVLADFVKKYRAIMPKFVQLLLD